MAVSQGRDGVFRLVRGVHGHDLVALRHSFQQVLQSGRPSPLVEQGTNIKSHGRWVAVSPVGVLRSHDDVHLGKAPGDVAALLLSHAARHDDGHLLALPLALRMRAQVRVHLVQKEQLSVR